MTPFRSRWRILVLLLALPSFTPAFDGHWFETGTLLMFYSAGLWAMWVYYNPPRGWQA